MTSVPPTNPINQPPLTVEQIPADVTVPVYTQSPKSPLSMLFNILFFIFGIGGIVYGIYMQSLYTKLKQSPSASDLKTTVSPLSPTIMPSFNPSQTSSSSASYTSSNEETVLKETLCFTLVLPKNNDIGAENNCDIVYRSFPDSNSPDTMVSVSVTLNNKEYQNSQDMAEQWMQMEKDQGSEDTLVEQTSVMVGGLPGYKIITEYSNKSVQTTHIFIYNPGKYEAYGYPITGFELLSASDINTRPVQQKELERLLLSWIWK